MNQNRFSQEILREIINELLKQKTLTHQTAEKTVKKICKKHKLSDIPTNIQILEACDATEREKLKEILLMKPMRTISGVAVVTVVAKPAGCVSDCIYCPNIKNAPKSYVGLEPAIQRAIRRKYDPFLQVQDRLRQFRLMGHLSDNGSKCEVIILGGTFLALDKLYKEQFIKRIFDALNEKESLTLEESQKINETAKHRCCNLTFETRPDYCKEKHVDEMLKYGVTRVEIGVQSIYPEILQLVNRGHTIEDVVDATRIAKDVGLKCCFHLMPDLPSSDLDKDLEMFKIVFENPDFRPDYLKIYPTVVVKNTELYKMWKKKDYQPYTLEELVELLAKAKKFIPKYCRIQRLGRDIPSTEIEDGCKRSNLREIVQQKAKELSISCNCIRCREVGFKIQHGICPDIRHIKLCRLDYNASNGKEVFLSFEDVKNNIILGFLRLRIPENSHRPEIDSQTALIRELKVMGSSVPIGLLPDNLQWQHRGYGKELMTKAEELSFNEFDKKKIVVMSAIGTKEYYYKLGYKPDGMYVSKTLQLCQ